jgi:hypothetical protein
MIKNPFVAATSPGRLHLSLRTLAANDNVSLEATAPPPHADGGISTRWPVMPRGQALRRISRHDLFAQPEAFPAPSLVLGVEAGKRRGARLS